MMTRLVISVFAYIFLITALIQPAAAHPYKKEVLGESVQASDIDVPPVTAGPGIILPDSPFYVLDKVLQKVKLALAYTPDKKALVHDSVSQERLAELRIMMAKNNIDGVKLALTELAKENKSAAVNLREAAAAGKDVKLLAVRLNDSMKFQRTFLTGTSDQASGSLRLQLKAAKEELMNAKVEVEDQLPEDVLLKEVEENISLDIEEEVGDTGVSAAELERSVSVLEKLASEAALKQQENREVALINTIELKNESLRRQHENQMRLEKLKREEAYRLKKEAAEQVRETVKSARETAIKFEQAKLAAEELALDR